MFYNSRSGPPVPADAPYGAHVNERKQWEYHQKRHEEAIRNICGHVDRSHPNSSNLDVQATQARCRKFAVDARNAEIGRSNRILVERLTKVAKSPSVYSVRGAGGSGSSRPPVASGATERARSLNDDGRRQMQKRIDADNANMVRRIISLKSCFNAVEDEKNFQRHTRDSRRLQRMPDKQLPRSLPPLGRPRPQSHSMPAKGVEALMLPTDLRRSQSGPGVVGNQALLESGELQNPAHATTAPAGSLPDASRPDGTVTFSEGGPLGSQTYSFGGFDTFNSMSEVSQSGQISREASTAAPAEKKDSAREGSVSQNTLPRPAVGPEAEEEAGSAAKHASAFGKQDAETERRQWLQEADQQGSSQGAAGSVGITAQGSEGAERPNSRMGLTGISNVSEMKYADDWDEYSFNSSANPDASKSVPSRGPSSMSVGRTTSGATGTTSGQTQMAAASTAESSPLEDYSSPPDFSSGKRGSRRGAGNISDNTAAVDAVSAEPSPVAQPAEDYTSPPDFSSGKKGGRRGGSGRGNTADLAPSTEPAPASDNASIFDEPKRDDVSGLQAGYSANPDNVPASDTAEDFSSPPDFTSGRRKRPR